MTKEQWQLISDLIDDGDDFEAILEDMELLDVFYLGYEFCQADKQFMEE